jgi:hypothetical protein
MCGRLLDSDPELAYRHARTAADRAGRVAIVRETAGIAAYATDRYAEAARELRTYQRLTGYQDYLPVIADCERGLGRPERAIAIATSAEGRGLTGDGQVEMLSVLAGARADLGEFDASFAVLARAARLAGAGESAGRVVAAKERIEALAAGADAAEIDTVDGWSGGGGGAGEGEGGTPDGLEAASEDEVKLFDVEEGVW